VAKIDEDIGTPVAPLAGLKLTTLGSTVSAAVPAGDVVAPDVVGAATVLNAHTTGAVIALPLRSLTSGVITIMNHGEGT